MKRVISATEARVNFGKLMRRVAESGETYIIERSGKPTLAVLSISEYERLSGQQEGQSWQELVARARAAIKDDLGDQELPPPAAIIQQMREEREEQLLALR